MTVDNARKPGIPGLNQGYVEVETEELVGVVFLGILFLLVFLALLRSQRRERKLLREIANLHARRSV